MLDRQLILFPFVSCFDTEEQKLENQKKAISEKYEIDEWVEEKVSGMVDYTKRNLGELIDKLENGDTLIITELSRLGRSISMIFDIISMLKKRNVRCVAIKNNFDMNPTYRELEYFRNNA